MNCPGLLGDAKYPSDWPARRRAQAAKCLAQAPRVGDGMLAFAAIVAMPVACILSLPFAVFSVVYLIEGDLAMAAEGFGGLAVMVGVVLPACWITLVTVGAEGRPAEIARPGSVAMWDAELDQAMGPSN